MTQTRAPRNWLKNGIIECISADRSKIWEPEEVAKILGRENIDSVNTGLDSAHRDPDQPIERVGPRQYRYRSLAKALVMKQPADTKNHPTMLAAPHPETGMLMEIVTIHKGKIIATDGDNMWLVSMKFLA